jgi:hypothetical protein
MDEIEVAQDLCSIAAWINLAEMDLATVLVEQAAGVLAARSSVNVYELRRLGGGRAVTRHRRTAAPSSTSLSRDGIARSVKA